MAFLFSTGFDLYATADLTKEFTQVLSGSGDGGSGIQTSSGRRSTQNWRSLTSGGTASGNRLAKVFDSPAPSGTTCIFGFAFKVTGGAFATLQVSTTEGNNSSNVLWSLWKSNTNHVWCRINTNGTVSVYNGSTLLGTSASALTHNTFQYLEFKIVIDNSSGSIEMRVDGSNSGWLNLTSKDTQNGSSTDWDELRLWGSASAGTSPQFIVDDVYVLDGSGSTSNDFLGDLRVDVSYPNAAGSHSDWTRSTGADQWATVDEALVNSDTDYNSTATVNNIDTLNFPNAPVTGADIFAINVKMAVRKSDAGSAGIKAAVRIGGTDFLGDERTVPSSYVYKQQLWDRKPSDGSAWTDTDFNSSEFGYQKTS